MNIPANQYTAVTVVWGSYIKTFLEYCIPTLLGEGNILFLSKPITYLIYTTPAGRNKLLSHPNFFQLKQLIKIEIQLITDESSSPLQIMTVCHQHAFNSADQLDTGIFNIMPDCLFSKNVFLNIEKEVSDGYRLISTANLRVNLETTCEILEKTSNMKGELTICPRDLVSLSMENLHQLSQINVVNHDSNDFIPNAMLWEIPNEGYVGKYFYGCHFYIHPENKNLPLNATMDLDYIYQACPTKALHTSLLNSDQGIIVEMSQESRVAKGFPKLDISHIYYYSDELNEYQLSHANRTFIIHNGIKKKQLWDNEIEKSKKMIKDIYQHRNIMENEYEE